MRRRSPLHGVSLPDGVRELPFPSHIDVRLDHTDDAAVSAASEALGFTLPMTPNTVATDERLAALWLGPDEWLVVGPQGNEVQLDRTLSGALAGRGSVVDVSANRTTLELRGPRTRAILESGCSIDLHPRSFGPGDCAQTLLARANVILWQTATVPGLAYRLLVRSSLSAYVAAWLADASIPDR